MRRSATLPSGACCLVPDEPKALPAMNVIKTLWASVQGDPVLMRRLNGWLTIFWIVMIPISMAMGWLDSVVYVSALSLWALVSGHWAAWQAARVEVTQERQAAELAEQDLPGEIVERLVEETTINVDSSSASTAGAAQPVRCPCCGRS